MFAESTYICEILLADVLDETKMYASIGPELD